MCPKQFKMVEYHRILAKIDFGPRKIKTYLGEMPFAPTKPIISTHLGNHKELPLPRIDWVDT